MSDEIGAAPGRTWRHWVPIAEWLPRYDRGWLRGDLLAGAVVAALAVPQALGYASIAGAERMRRSGRGRGGSASV